MTHQSKRTKGFTLIELLVVISIIALLASIVFASLNSARAKARDARRVADLNQIRTALEFYFDSNNAYPFVGAAACNPGLNAYNDGWCRDSTDNTGTTPIQNWISGLTPFLSAMPSNPKPYGAGWPYHYCSGTSCGGANGTNQKYWLMVILEVTPSLTCPTRTYLWYDGSGCPWGAGQYTVKNF